MLDKSKIYFKSKKAEPVFLFVLKIFSIFLLISLVTYHIKLLNHPFPAEIREGGDLLTIKALSDNINPYALTNQPIYFNPYGIVYPLLAKQLATFFGVTLFSGRFLSAVTIFISLFLIFVALRNERINFWYCIFGMIVFYSNILFLVTPILRPDSLGTLFLLLSILLPVTYKYNYLSLFTGLLFSLIAFYTKEYFILGFLILISYIFLFKSMKKAIVLFACFMVSFIASTILISRIYECYFYNTFLAQLFAVNNDHLYAIHQLMIFFVTNSGFSIILIAAILLFFYNKKNSSSKSVFGLGLNNNNNSMIHTHVQNFKSGRGLLNYNLSFYAFLFSCILLLLVFKLGGHRGAYMTYYYQLLSFPFIIIVLKQPILYSKKIFYLLITLTLITSCSKYLFQNYSDKDNIAWIKLEKLIQSSKNVFGTAEIAPLLIQKGSIPYYSGFTEGFIFSTLSRKVNKMFPYTANLIKKNTMFIDTIEKNIKDKKFDVLILDDEYSDKNKDLISQTYHIRDSIDLKFYHSQQKVKLYVWEPIPIK